MVSAARVFPARAPDFGAAIGVGGPAGAWRPVGRLDAPELFRDGDAFVGALAGDAIAPIQASRQIALAAVLLAAVAFVRSRSSAGASILLAFLYLVLVVSASEAPRSLGSPTVWPLAIGVATAPMAIAGLRRAAGGAMAPARTAIGYGLLIVSILAAARIDPPELNALGQRGWSTLCDLAGLIALVVSALAFRAAGTRPPRDAQRWLTAAVVFTTLAILISLALVSPSPAMPAAVFLLAIVGFELWARAVGPRGEEPFVLPRLLAGAALLLVLIVSPVREFARVTEAFRVAAAIRLPNPQRPSTGAVAAAQRAATRIAQFDLRRDLPAPPEETDLSDLAYRIWRDGSHGPEGQALISYEVFDSGGRSRSRFSLIPEAENSAEAQADEVRIDRFRLAIVRRRVPLWSGGGVWGFVRVDVADWPSWDPLPPRIGVYRRLVLGALDETGASAAPPRGRSSRATDWTESRGTKARRCPERSSDVCVERISRCAPDFPFAARTSAASSGPEATGTAWSPCRCRTSSAAS